VVFGLLNPAALGAALCHLNTDSRITYSPISAFRSNQLRPTWEPGQSISHLSISRFKTTNWAAKYSPLPLSRPSSGWLPWIPQHHHLSWSRSSHLAKSIVYSLCSIFTLLPSIDSRSFHLPLLVRTTILSLRRGGLISQSPSDRPPSISTVVYFSSPCLICRLSRSLLSSSHSLGDSSRQCPTAA
jgi:hypothetical protein